LTFLEKFVIIYIENERGVIKMKQYEFGLVCGRFQTFHLGHEKLIDTALSMCEKVLVFIGSAQESGTERNPYDAEFRKRILRAVYGEREDLIFKDLEDLTDENDITPEWGKYVLDHAIEALGRKPDVLFMVMTKREVDGFLKKI
jgi:nicotinamide-nucleotide adenylyltransferase